MMDDAAAEGKSRDSPSFVETADRLKRGECDGLPHTTTKLLIPHTCI
jgi:hypothetical protein